MHRFTYRRKTFFLLLPALLTAGSAQADDLKSPAKDLSYAENLVTTEHIEAATPLLERYVKRKPNDAKAWCLLGICYLGEETINRSNNRAQACFKKSLSLDPHHSLSYTKLAVMAGMDGNYQEQIRLATAALACPQPDKKALRIRAIAYSNLHKDREALADYEKYLASGLTNPHGPKTLEAYATFLENAGQLPKAIKVMHELETKFKGGHQFFRTEARYWQKLGNSDKALALLDKLLGFDPSNELAYQDRARIYESKGKLELALKDYNKTIELIPNSRSYLERAKLYERMGKPEKARADLERANSL